MFETHAQLLKKQEERKNRIVKKPQKRTFKTPLDAIRAKCKECSNGSRSEVENCLIIDCPLWTYRRKKLSKLPKELEDLEIIE